MQKPFGSAQRSPYSSRSRDLPLRGVLGHGWPVNGISLAAYGRSDSRPSGCCHPFYSRCCRFFEEGFWARIPIATDKLYELAHRIRSHSISGQNRGRFSLRGFLFRGLRRISGERPRALDRSGRRYACGRLLSSRRLCLRRRNAARYAADSLDGARGDHSELRWLRALLPVAKADPPSVSQLRARSCTRCRVLSPLWPTANEHGTATLTGRILKMNRRTSVRVHEARKGESHMKQTAMLTTASLLTILFMTFHLTGDILFHMAPAGLVNLLALFIFLVQLYGTLVLGERRAGYVIIFLGSALALVVPVVHMNGTRGVIGGDIGTSSQAFLFVWTILALSITATFSVILSAIALLSSPWRRSRRASPAA